MRNAAFTLIEIAIALIIIGLVAGGIVVGQNMIRTSEIRAVASDVEKYQLGIATFRMKYHALPGDMQNATDFWGAADGAGNGNTAICKTTTATSIATCNGNGDNAVRPDVISSHEEARLWQHLANAGIISGSFSGVASISSTSEQFMEPGVNVPAARGMSNVGYSFLSTNSNLIVAEVGSSTWWFGDYNLVLSVGQSYTNGETRVPFLTAFEAMNIDRKVDDGRPGTGNLHGRRSAGLCSTTGASSTAEYNIANKNITCSLRYLLNM